MPPGLFCFSFENMVVKDVKDQKNDFLNETFLKPYSKSLLQAQDLQEDGANNIVDTLKNISGITAKDRGSYQKGFSIRGFGGSRVSSFIDGAKVSNHGLDMGGGADLGSIDTQSVNSIEVIKGSPSVIYDPGAVGGLVLVDTLGGFKSGADFANLRLFGGYDWGYFLDKQGAGLSVKKGIVYAYFLISRARSADRLVKNKAKQRLILEDTNARQERFDEYRLSNFGYKQEAQNFKIGLDLGVADLLYKYGFTKTRDVTFAVGLDNPLALHYDSLKKDTHLLRLALAPFGAFKKARFSVDYSTQERIVTSSAVNLKTLANRLDLETIFDSYGAAFGLEYTKDWAHTRVFSEQDYLAAYLENTFYVDPMVFYAGLRSNNHYVKQNLRPGQNEDLAKDLEGVSGILKRPLVSSKFNFSAGAVYSFSENFNAGLNFSTTYRYPSLYERFAFDGTIIGGGVDLTTEEGKNYELSFKYLDDFLSWDLSVFYTDFSVYNSLREHKKIKDKAALEACKADSACDPYSREKENDLFETSFIYTSFKNVKRKGVEFDLQKTFAGGLDLAFNAAQTQISPSIYITKSGAKLTQHFANEPLELKVSLTKRFFVFLRPWLRIRQRYINDVSRIVPQDKKFALSVTDFYAGLKHGAFNLNAGVRNIFDNIYHETYSPFDGIKRSAFVNVSVFTGFGF